MPEVLAAKLSFEFDGNFVEFMEASLTTTTQLTHGLNNSVVVLLFFFLTFYSDI